MPVGGNVGTSSRIGNPFRLCAGLSAAGFLFGLCSPGRLAASGYEFDGVGARSVARGGAVAADADDWTAIYWNPAGLVNVKGKEAGLELRGGQMCSKDGNSFSSLGEVPQFSKTRATSGFVIGSIGTVIPLDDKSAMAAGAYTPLLQGSVFKDDNLTGFPATSLNYKSTVIAGVGNISYARKFTDRFSAGLGVNALYGSLSATSKIGWSALLPFYLAPVAGKLQKTETDADGYGLEAELGATYELNDRWKAGAVARSGARVLLQGQSKAFLDGAFVRESDMKMPVHHPPTTSFGVAWKADRDLKITCDFSQTWWGGFTNHITYDSPDAIYLPDHPNTYHWVTSYKFRLGALKRLSPKTEVMAGYAFDTPAIDSKSVDFSSAIDVPMHRVSAAVSHTWSPIETTLGALAGSGRRTAGGVNYSVKGYYVIGEAKYRF